MRRGALPGIPRLSRIRRIASRLGDRGQDLHAPLARPILVRSLPAWPSADPAILRDRRSGYACRCRAIGDSAGARGKVLAIGVAVASLMGGFGPNQARADAVSNVPGTRAQQHGFDTTNLGSKSSCLRLEWHELGERRQHDFGRHCLRRPILPIGEKSKWGRIFGSSAARPRPPIS